MLKKRINYFTMLATGLFFCTLGFSLIFDSLTTWNWVYYTFVIGIASIGVIKILNILINFWRLKHKFTQFAEVIIWILAFSFMVALPDAIFTILPRLIGCWISLHAFVKIVVLWIRTKDHLPISFHTIPSLIGDLIMMFCLFINPTNHEQLISYVMAAYFIVYGCNTLLDMIREMVPKGSGEALDRKIRLSIPPFLQVIIPPQLMRTLLNKDQEDQIKDHFEEIKQDIPIDMEVLIHLAPNGPAMLGHADIIYRGLVMSYGCYDPHNRQLLGTMGDGVVIIAPRNSYIKNCLEHENKILISFGISLNHEQKQKLNDRIIEIFSTFVDFESDEQKKQKGEPCVGMCDDYISRVTRTSSEARFYKIKEGKLKTFFVVSSNCVFFLSSILSCIGFNLFDLSGIISPGSYYDFLNKQFKSEKGFVVSRKLYRKRDAHEFD